MSFETLKFESSFDLCRSVQTTQAEWTDGLLTHDSAGY